MLEKTYLDILKRHHLSNTSARRTVFRALTDATKPLRMIDLLNNCPAVDRVTVYRIIETFEKVDIVHRVQIGWKYVLELSDVFQSHHHHAVCEVCGCVININEPQSLEAELQKLCLAHNFRMNHHSIELQGVCGKCLKIGC